VTERRAMEERLAQAQKMEAIGRLAGGVAHDFNNLLTVILSNAQLAAAEAPPGSPLHDLLGPIRDAAQRAAGLTRQLLAFAKRQVVSPRVVDLNALVRDLGRLLQRLLGERVVVAARLSPDLEPIRVDPGQIEQVLVNLAVNARDAMPDGGRLSIQTANVVVGSDEAAARGLAPGAYVRLSVSDTGRGMDRETARRAFEPFFTTKGDRGTGLGLATSLGAVQQAGGQIAVDSAPGAGATFHVFLPRHAGPARARTTPQPGPASGGHAAATVLVVEDDEAVRATAVRALRRAGYGILAAATGAEALRVAADHAGAIDLLLTDVVLPGMNGREVAERLAALRPEMRILFVSGYAEDDALRRDAAAGTAPVRTKPYTPADLEAWVAEALESPAPALTSPASSRAS
jgi:two-component system cell cycle sensor histidine kinase/response regulator CckA